MNKPSPARLRLTYDTEQNPLSFDFVVCLAICRAYCNIQKLPDTFDVVLANRDYRNVGVEGKYTPEYRDRKMRDVVITTALLCKWVNSIYLVRGDTPIPPHSGPTIPLRESLEYIGKAPQWHITPMVPKQLEALFAQGATLPEPGFAASEAIKARYRDRLRNAVVIHPRVSIHTPQRNTDKAKMNEVVAHIRARGMEAFFVPDIEDMRAGFTWSDFTGTILIEAAFDFEARLAVAEVAAMNVVYSGGGNVNMLQYAKTKFLWTGFMDESERVTSIAFTREKGSTIGVNPPWLDAATQFYDFTPRNEVTPEYMLHHIIRLMGR